MQRRCFSDRLKALLVATVSARALIIFSPVLMSLAHTGHEAPVERLEAALAVGRLDHGVDVVGGRHVVAGRQERLRHRGAEVGGDLVGRGGGDEAAAHARRP